MFRIYSSVDNGETPVQIHGSADTMEEANVIAHEAYADGEEIQFIFIKGPDDKPIPMLFNLDTANAIECAV